MATTDPLVFRTFDGMTYQCRKLPSMRAFQLTTELVRYLGSPLSTILAGAGDPSVTPEAIFQYILREGFDNLPPTAARDLMLRVMESVTFADSKGAISLHLGDEQRFDAHFDQRPGGIATAIEVWIWALQHNFQRFFDAARSRLTPPEQATAPASEGSVTVMA